jgi:diketogulonate reductase-like aldo/keto reductase
MPGNDYVISASGVRSPRILYGTAWKKTQTEALVAKAIGRGFRGIDTACQPKHYHEPGVGAGVAACLSEKQGREKLDRADLYLQTKFTPLPGQAPNQIPYDPTARLAVQIAQSFQTSLRNLQTSYLDCLVLHSPLTDDAQAAEAWQAMEVIVDSGGARQLGISNCYSLAVLESLYLSSRLKPAVVQNRFYAETHYDREIRAFCRQRGIIYQSFWTLSANPHLLTHDTLKTLASQYGRTPEQILFRYLTQEDVVPLTGTQSDIHMREDLEIFAFELTAKERATVTALL